MYKIHTPHLVGPTMPSSVSKRRLPAVPKWALAAREWIFSHHGDFERLDAVGVPRKQIPSSVSLVRKPFGTGRNQGRSFVGRAFTVVPWGGFRPNSLRGRLVLFGVPLVVLFLRLPLVRLLGVGVPVRRLAVSQVASKKCGRTDVRIAFLGPT